MLAGLMLPGRPVGNMYFAACEPLPLIIPFRNSETGY